jgi:hypothetical protein
MMSINGIRNIDRDLHYLIDMFDCLDLPEEETGSTVPTRKVGTGRADDHSKKINR